jgi:signal-transduction protein with cAMP-binding, CBS, and nucleotidyltransferase domain
VRLCWPTPSFHGLPPQVLAQTAATVEIAYFPAAPASCGRAASPSRYLHVIVKGVVELRQADQRSGWELVEKLTEGETFGQLSLLSRSPTWGTWSPARTFSAT